MQGVVASRDVKRVCIILGLTGAFAGCGGGERQDANEPDRNFDVRVVQASFPAAQKIAEGTRMRIAVRNSGDRAIPNVAVTIDGFSSASQEPGLADPNRPVWIIDQGPRGGDTAYVGTWALGRVEPGRTRTFSWQVTPVVPGRHVVKFSVAAGLNGKAKAQAAGGGRAAGRFDVEVSGKPSDSRVDPSTGAVVPG